MPLSDVDPLGVGSRLVDDVGKRGFTLEIGFEVHSATAGRKTDYGLMLGGVHIGGQYKTGIFPGEGEGLRHTTPFGQEPYIVAVFFH